MKPAADGWPEPVEPAPAWAALMWAASAALSAARDSTSPRYSARVSRVSARALCLIDSTVDEPVALGGEPIAGGASSVRARADHRDGRRLQAPRVASSRPAPRQRSAWPDPPPRRRAGPACRCARESRRCRRGRRSSTRTRGRRACPAARRCTRSARALRESATARAYSACRRSRRAVCAREQLGEPIEPSSSRRELGLERVDARLSRLDGRLRVPQLRDDLGQLGGEHPLLVLRRVDARLQRRDTGIDGRLLPDVVGGGGGDDDEREPHEQPGSGVSCG